MLTQKQINGWYDWQPLITRIVKNQLPRNPKYTEVGVWHGKSLVDFVHLCLAEGKTPTCIGIDLFGGKQDDEYMDKTVENLGGDFMDITESNIFKAEVEDYVTLVRAFSTEAAKDIPDESQDCILIDALHKYKAVKEDTEAYWPKLKKGGWMLWHDCDRDEVRRAAEEVVGRINVEQPRTGFKQKL